MVATHTDPRNTGSVVINTPIKYYMFPDDANLF